MKLFNRRQEEVVPETPARHHLAEYMARALATHPGVSRLTTQVNNEGPLGGISDTLRVTFHHEDRETLCVISIYGDSPTERMDRMGV